MLSNATMYFKYTHGNTWAEWRTLKRSSGRGECFIRHTMQRRDTSIGHGGTLGVVEPSSLLKQIMLT